VLCFFGAAQDQVRTPGTSEALKNIPLVCEWEPEAVPHSFEVESPTVDDSWPAQAPAIARLCFMSPVKDQADTKEYEQCRSKGDERSFEQLGNGTPVIDDASQIPVKNRRRLSKRRSVRHHELMCLDVGMSPKGRERWN